MLLLGIFAGAALAAKEDSSNLANPIRRVVTLLQKMQSSVAAEGEKEKKLFEEFMCYCKTGMDDLQKSMDAAENQTNSSSRECLGSSRSSNCTAEERY